MDNRRRGSKKISLIFTDSQLFLPFLFFGRGGELLKTVSTRISLHFSQIQEMSSLFRN